MEVIFGAGPPPAVRDPFSPAQVSKVDFPRRLDRVGAYGLANSAQ
jgi:hypothetical protein